MTTDYVILESDPGDELGNDTTTPLPPAPPTGPDVDEVVKATSLPPEAAAVADSHRRRVQVKLPRPLHGPTARKPGDSGVDVLAVKRATARAFPDVYSWADFDQVYNRRLQSALKVIQKGHGISPTGNYGKGTHDLLAARHRQGFPGEWAFDQTSINLLEQEWHYLTKPKVSHAELVQAAMSDYMHRTLTNAARIHYLQRRAMTTLGESPEASMSNDCSEGATDIFFWARLVTKLAVPDPNGRGFDGYGNTDTLWQHNEIHRVSTEGVFQVGDMALYSRGHVIVCMVAGDRNTAVWWSNGSESAPNATRLYYRDDLRGVVRPLLLAA